MTIPPAPPPGPVLDPLVPILTQVDASLVAGTLTYRNSTFPAGMKVRARIAFENGEGIGPWTAWSNTVTIGPRVIGDPLVTPGQLPVAFSAILLGGVITVAPKNVFVASSTSYGLTVEWDNGSYTSYGVHMVLEKSTQIGGSTPAAGTFQPYVTLTVPPGNSVWSTGSIANPGSWFRVSLKFFNQFGDGPSSNTTAPAMITN